MLHRYGIKNEQKSGQFLWLTCWNTLISSSFVNDYLLSWNHLAEEMYFAFREHLAVRLSAKEFGGKTS
jgi:hypothetical protein